MPRKRVVTVYTIGHSTRPHGHAVGEREDARVFARAVLEDRDAGVPVTIAAATA